MDFRSLILYKIKMRIVSYGELGIKLDRETIKTLPDSIFLFVESSMYSQIAQEMPWRNRKYRTEFVFGKINAQWQGILKALDYQTQGKRVLDLGCGARKGTVESKKYGCSFDPLLGRFAYETKEKTGLEYVGVDCGDLSGEEFPHRQLDLLEEGALMREFPENYFDIATAFMLFNSSELEKRVSGKDVKNASEESAGKLRDVLIPQLERIVKPGGCLVWYGDKGPGAKYENLF